jgi:hypothetical protein
MLDLDRQPAREKFTAELLLPRRSAENGHKVSQIFNFLNCPRVWILPAREKIYSRATVLLPEGLKKIDLSIGPTSNQGKNKDKLFDVVQAREKLNYQNVPCCTETDSRREIHSRASFA